VAALEVEQAVKRLAGAGDAQRVRLLIDKLIAEYAFSPQANHRKVAARALAAGRVELMGASHCTALHCIALHCVALHFVALR
jgi:vacuole morphology and inheritance protein 14